MHSSRKENNYKELLQIKRKKKLIKSLMIKKDTQNSKVMMKTTANQICMPLIQKISKSKALKEK